jgi:hypothetical protein
MESWMMSRLLIKWTRQLFEITAIILPSRKNSFFTQLYEWKTDLIHAPTKHECTLKQQKRRLSLISVSSAADGEKLVGGRAALWVGGWVCRSVGGMGTPQQQNWKSLFEEEKVMGTFSSPNLAQMLLLLEWRSCIENVWRHRQRQRQLRRQLQRRLLSSKQQQVWIF